MQDCKEHDILVVTTTVGAVADGERLARAVVAQRLAACVQLEPHLTSVYRWDGELCQEAECRLTLKTLAPCLTAIERLFAAEHPYTLPQLVALPAVTSAAYAAWVRSEVVLP